jgi:hypothetical protein
MVYNTALAHQTPFSMETAQRYAEMVSLSAGVEWCFQALIQLGAEAMPIPPVLIERAHKLRGEALRASGEAGQIRRYVAFWRSSTLGPKYRHVRELEPNQTATDSLLPGEKFIEEFQLRAKPKNSKIAWREADEVRWSQCREGRDFARLWATVNGRNFAEVCGQPDPGEET